MVDMKAVEKYRADFQNMSDAELTAQMHQWVPHSDMHVAAKLILAERHTRQERQRFHLIFWPALVAAFASVVALFLR